MNRLNGDLFKGTMQVVDDAINDVEPAITVDNIDQVVCYRNFYLKLISIQTFLKSHLLSTTALISITSQSHFLDSRWRLYPHSDGPGTAH